MYNNLLAFPMPTYIYRSILGKCSLSMSKRIANDVAIDIESKKLGLVVPSCRRIYKLRNIRVIFIGLLLGFFIARMDFLINIFGGLINIPRLIIVIWAGIGPLIMRLE